MLAQACLARCKTIQVDYSKYTLQQSKLATGGTAEPTRIFASRKRYGQQCVKLCLLQSLASWLTLLNNMHKTQKQLLLFYVDKLQHSNKGG